MPDIYIVIFTVTLIDETSFFLRIQIEKQGFAALSSWKSRACFTSDIHHSDVTWSRSTPVHQLLQHHGWLKKQIFWECRYYPNLYTSMHEPHRNHVSWLKIPDPLNQVSIKLVQPYFTGPDPKEVGYLTSPSLLPWVKLPCERPYRSI